MSYAITIFCTDDTTPSIGALTAAIGQPGYTLTSRSRRTVFTADSTDWERVELRTRGRHVATCELEFAAGGIFPDLQPFVDSIRHQLQRGFPGSTDAQRFDRHLVESALIVSIAVEPDMDPEEDWPAIHTLANYWVDSNGGLIHYEGGGFVERADRPDPFVAVF